MIEKPIERLNYVNGERLKARDLHDEQEYHIRVRRWLNKSLYSAGIAEGLEVRAEPDRKDDKGRLVILVSPGLALDSDGREMILVEEAEVPIMGNPTVAGQPVEGNYLYIQYHEEKLSEETESYATRDNNKLAWGGPTRVRATPILGWSNVFPHESSGKVVLAQVELDDKDCSVRHVHSYPRRYIGPASNAMVRQYALEGERHIDENNSGRIYFHIRGQQPTSVILYLRAEKFSTLFYTEMGQHKHGLHIGQKIPTSDPVLDSDRKKYLHSHTANDAYIRPTDTDKIKLKIDSDNYTDEHDHVYKGQLSGWNTGSGNQFGLVVSGVDVTKVQEINNDIDGEFLGGHHSHVIRGSTDETTADISHTHTFSPTVSMDNAGIPDSTYQARGGNPDNPTDQISPLTYVDDLQIYIGKTGFPNPYPNLELANRFTDEILRQLKSALPAIYGGRVKLGTGDAQDPLHNYGTGPIRLDLLSPNLSFPEGEYFIDLVVDNKSGGRILYNLYVE